MEIIADYKQHIPGEREVVDWTRNDGVTYRNVPVMYIKETTKDSYLDRFPHVELDPNRCYFWEVSID